MQLYHNKSFFMGNGNVSKFPITETSEPNEQSLFILKCYDKMLQLPFSHYTKKIHNKQLFCVLTKPVLRCLKEILWQTLQPLR